MSKIYNSVEELIGKTPLLRLGKLEERFALKARILAKLESNNPAGSAKDRVARAMIDDAERKGLIKEGSTIIEATSGNTGIGLATVGTSRGYKVKIIMPDTMSKERIKIMKAYGAEVILTDGALGMSGAIKKAEELEKSTPDTFIARQFTNQANVQAHYDTTGPEIYNDTDGEVDIFVASIGTGGTISGTGRYLKQKKPTVRVVGVEPSGSPVLSGGQSGAHKIQGIGAGFVPEILDTSLLDEVVTVGDSEAFEYTRHVSKTEGILVGISSGAALCAAIKEAQKEENSGKTIVVLFPDSGERYLSGEVFDS